jgi:hypothetical protein
MYDHRVTEPTSDQPGGGIPLNITTNVHMHPDGKHRVVIAFMDPLMSVQIAIPPDMADVIADRLPADLRANAQQARLLDSGLVVASSMPSTGVPTT